MDEFCREKGFAKWFETSAKENINIDASTRFLISEVNIQIFVKFHFSSSSSDNETHRTITTTFT